MPVRMRGRALVPSPHTHTPVWTDACLPCARLSADRAVHCMQGGRTQVQLLGSGLCATP